MLSWTCRTLSPAAVLSPWMTKLSGTVIDRATVAGLLDTGAGIALGRSAAV